MGAVTLLKEKNHQPNPTDEPEASNMMRTAIAVASSGTNRLDILALGENYQLYHKTWTGTEWFPQNWESLGRVPMHWAFALPGSLPYAVASWGDNRLDIFGLSYSSGMYHKAWTGTAWWPSQTDWEPLGDPPLLKRIERDKIASDIFLRLPNRCERRYHFNSVDIFRNRSKISLISFGDSVLFFAAFNVAAIY
jgi:hypothetical protein